MLCNLDFNECVFNNGGCAQQCINKITTNACHCYDGFTLDSDGANCSGMLDLMQPSV